MMSDATTVAATAASATAVIGGAQILGIEASVIVGAIAGVAFFMLQSTDRGIVSRVALFVPSSIGTAFAADAVSSWFALSAKITPIIAFTIGLVFVLMSSAWIRKAQGRGFFSSAFNWIIDKLLALRSGK